MIGAFETPNNAEINIIVRGSISNILNFVIITSQNIIAIENLQRANDFLLILAI
jgi:hypothetical protein